MMNDHISDKQLSQYVVRSLTDSQRDTIDAHLNNCPKCRAKLSEHEALKRRVRYSILAKRKQFTPPSSMNYAAIAARVEKNRRVFPFWILSAQYGALAVGLVIVAVLMGVLINQRHITIPSNLTSFPAVVLETLSFARDHEYVSIPLAAITDQNESDNNNLGLLPGIQYFPEEPEIPFEVGSKATTQCRFARNSPTQIDIQNINIHKPAEVYILLQAGWALKSHSGKQIGEIVLGFSDGSSLRTSLTLGKNIRDWRLGNPAAVTTALSEHVKQVWVGWTETEQTLGRIDMLTIQLPDHYRKSTLSHIEIHDLSTESWSAGAIDPCIHLVAITVKQRK